MRRKIRKVKPPIAVVLAVGDERPGVWLLEMSEMNAEEQWTALVVDSFEAPTVEKHYRDGIKRFLPKIRTRGRRRGRKTSYGEDFGTLGLSSEVLAFVRQRWPSCSWSVGCLGPGPKLRKGTKDKAGPGAFAHAFVGRKLVAIVSGRG